VTEAAAFVTEAVMMRFMINRFRISLSRESFGFEASNLVEEFGREHLA